MKPKIKLPVKMNSDDFEKPKVGVLVNGTIQDIRYDEKHVFKGYKDNPDRIAPAVQFVFSLENHQFPHRSRWLNFSYGSKSNLFKKFLFPLVEGATPEMDFDLDNLKGMKIKTLWSKNNEFHNLEIILPDGDKWSPKRNSNASIDEMEKQGVDAIEPEDNQPNPKTKSAHNADNEVPF